ncbi:MAG TPA: PHB depolymerase family esterase [Ktedonobacteraceae bacterium]|nr:PHB depolymerase family esterase [Ktedonobacteraceae bacterium]
MSCLGEIDETMSWTMCQIRKDRTVTFKRFTRGMVVVIFIGCVLFFRQSGQAQAASASAGQLQQFSYLGPAGQYTYDVYTPANYHLGTSVPLIVVLSGCTFTASGMAAATGMDTLADQKQFIVAYLQQNIFANSSLCWNFFLSSDQYRGYGEAAEIAGITQAVENNTSRWTINTHRAYLTGISAGGAMAVNMGAAYPDLYAAIGVHSGVEYQAVTAFSLSAAVTGGPPPVFQGDLAYQTMGSYARVVPTIDFQGSADTVVWPVNGDQVIQQWMETDYDASGGTYNASFANPSTTTYGQVPGGHSYTTYSWNNNQGQEIEEYWVVNGMGHAWSGGVSGQPYTDPYGPSANLAMYTFFMRFTH